MTLKDKAEDFAKRNNATIYGVINGNLGPMAYKVIKDDRKFHIYFAREWYRKYDGITIPKLALNEAVTDNAMIVMFVNDEEFWQHSSVWRLGKILENPMFHKIEVLQERRHLKKPGELFPSGMEQFFD